MAHIKIHRSFDVRKHEISLFDCSVKNYGVKEKTQITAGKWRF